MNQIQQTSLIAYYGTVLPARAEKQKSVLNAIIKLGKATDQDIAKHLGWPINCITPRRNELAKMGHITEAGTKTNDLGRLVMMWEVQPVTVGQN